MSRRESEENIKPEKREAGPAAEAAAPLAWPSWLLLSDAVVYWLALYQCVLITLFYREGVIPGWVRATGLSVCAVVVILGVAERKLVGPLWLRVTAFDLLLFIFIGAWLPWQFSGVKTARGLSFLWAAIEWWKLPGNIILMVRTAPVEFVLFWIAVLLLIWAITRGRKIEPIVAVGAFVAFYTYKLAGMEAGVRLPAYLVFDIGLVAALVAGLKGRLRLFCRILIIDSTFIIIFLFYLGVIPLFCGKPPGPERGINRIYPAAGNRETFPLVFLRDMQVDPRSGYLYTAYGPTSGIVRVKLETGQADIIPDPGIVRFLWTKPEMDEVFALDWMYADFYRIGKRDFKVKKITGLYDGLLVTPMSYAITGGKLYVVSTDYPALTRFDLATMKKEAAIDFRKGKVTGFRSGAWKCALDEKRRRLYVELGPVDLDGRYAVARVNLDTFAVERTGYLPEGGLELVHIERTNTLLAPSFFSEKIYEINAETLKINRVIKGPLTCRNIAVDAARDLLYATSYTRGGLLVIDRKTGKTLNSAKTGKKPSSLFYEPVADKLYFGSGEGIFGVDMKKFLRKKD